MADKLPENENIQTLRVSIEQARSPIVVEHATFDVHEDTVTKQPSEEDRKNSLSLAASFRLRSLQIDETQARLSKDKSASSRVEIEVHGTTLHNTEITKDLEEDISTQQHMVPMQKLCDNLVTNEKNGLTSDDAAARLRSNGPNSIKVTDRWWFFRILNHFIGGLGLMLWPSSLLCVLAYKPFGDPNPDPTNLGLAVVLVIVILLSGAFSWYQDWSSGRVMSSVNNMLPQTATVIRNGKPEIIPMANIVVGDLVSLESGTKVPADIRLASVNLLRVDNSILTGENEPIACTLQHTDTNIMETRNVVFMGANLVDGNASGIVIATGKHTMMGKLAKLANSTKSAPSTLRKQTFYFMIAVVIFALVTTITYIIIWATVLRRYFPTFMTFSTMLSNSIAIVIAFVPEGLAVCLTLTLTVVAKRMRENNVLVKNLPTVETLGAVSVIASDKTGTLTQNKMAVSYMYTGEKLMNASEGHCHTAFEQGDLAFMEMVRVCTLCNKAAFSESTARLPLQQRQLTGNASDSAILQFCEEYIRVSAMRSQFTKLAEIPFSSKLKYMVTIHAQGKNDKRPLLIMKGAAELMLDRCSTMLKSDGTEQVLTEDIKKTLSQQQLDLCNGGQRVLAACRLFLDENKYPISFEYNTDKPNFPLQGLCFVGFVSLMDPPREDVKESIAKCRKAGIRVMMVTGDHPVTAVAISKAIGIFSADKNVINFTAETKLAQKVTEHQVRNQSVSIKGPDVPNFDKLQWDYVFAHSEIVFARTTPEHKLTIVKECQLRGEIVAVTGDGVNDSAALKKAHCGVAMGAGSEVAREAAQIVLMDNRFSSLVNAISNGRLVFDNLRKVIEYLLPAGNWSEVFPVLAGAYMGIPLPLSPFLMIFICVATDVAPSLALIFEKPEGDLMERQPYVKSGERLVDWKLFLLAFGFIGNLEVICAFIMFFLYFWIYANMAPMDLIFAFDKYTNGYKGYTQTQLNEFLFTAQTIYFVALVLIQFGNLFSVRTKRLSIFQQPPIIKASTKNGYLFLGIIISLTLALFAVHLPVFNVYFNTRPIPTEFWFMPLGFALVVVILDEVRKVIVRCVHGLMKKPKVESTNAVDLAVV